MRASSSPTLRKRWRTCGGIMQALVGRAAVRLAVEVDLERAAHDVDELLGVRVVVLADPVAGLDDAPRP